MSKRQRGFSKKITIIGVMIIILITGTIYGIKTEKGKTQKAPDNITVRPVKAMTLDNAPGTWTLNFPGRVEAAKKAELSFRLAGKLDKLPVISGQKIQKGDLIAEIESNTYKDNLTAATSAVEEAKSKLEAMKKGARPEVIASIASELSSARAQEKEAMDQHNRYKSLYKEGAVAKDEMERFDTNWKMSKSQVRVAEEKLREAKKGARKEDVAAMESNIKGLEAQREKALSELSYTVLKAPFDGVITDKFVDNFQIVHAQQAIVMLQDLKSLDIKINVPASKMEVIKKGKDRDIYVVFESIADKKFKATVKDYSENADPVTQTYPVSLNVSTPEEGSLLPGMSSTVYIRMSTANKKTDVRSFKIPADALWGDEKGSKYLWIIDNDTDKISKIAVKTGQIYDNSIEVTGNLKNGDKVVIAGVSDLEEGEKVSIMNDQDN